MALALYGLQSWMIHISGLYSIDSYLLEQEKAVTDGP